LLHPAAAGARVLQISDEVLGQYYALGNPVLMKDDYEVRVLFCDDFNGVRDAGGKPLKPQELYAQKHDSFKVMKITEEYDRFEGDFKKFRETLPSRWMTVRRLKDSERILMTKRSILRKISQDGIDHLQSRP
jgi:hypothetical protein